MKRMLLSGLALAVCLPLAACGMANKNEQPAQYPTKKIEYIVPFAPGGGTDLISRKLAEVAEPLLGQQMVIINKPGGSGTLGPGEVMRAKTDGYTIGLSNNQAAVFTPKISKLPYKGPEDYQPVIKLSELPCVLTVRADSPYKSFEDFIQAAKKDPGKLRVSVAGKLTACDLVWQGQFAKEAGINVITAPFTGGAGEAATALLGGQVEASLGDLTAVMSHVRGGKMRALAVFQKERHPLLPDTKSIVEAGYSNTLPITYFVIGPKGMDPKILETLVTKLREAMAKSDFQEFAKTAGYRLDPKGPDELLAELKAQRTDYEKIIAALNIPQQ